MQHIIEQLKWVYGGLAGVCAAFFLALLGSNQYVSLSSSVPLFIAAICFGFALPVFTAFTIAHIGFVEVQTPSKVVQTALNKPWVIILTRATFLIFFLAFAALLVHISTVIGIFFIVTGMSVYFILIRFFKSLRQA